MPPFRALFPLLLLAASARAGDSPAGTPVLPPAPPWDRASRALAAAADDPFLTPFEAGGFRRTPRYDETVRWLERLAAARPEVRLVTLGTSPEGRRIPMAVVSAGGASSPRALRANGRPTLFVQAGIHPGEIDGKDAGLMLLRDLTGEAEKRRLLERVNLLFVPIVGVDGHERFGPFTRVNQRGPEEAGWRTNARNLNLNRDYAKLDSPEIRAIVRALVDWAPDLCCDIHVTDGCDYQYDITWGANGRHGHSPRSAAWIEETLTPFCARFLRSRGHVPGPLVFAVDNDPRKGIAAPTFGPRFSHGYGDLRHLPSLLVENHSLKPYDQRVFGTYLLLEATLRLLADRGAALREAAAGDRASRRPSVPLAWKAPEGPPPTAEFLGIGVETADSPVTGGKVARWTGVPVTLRVPFVAETEPALSAARPGAYLVPAAWPDVIERLRLHGIAVEEAREAIDGEFEMARILEPQLAREPFEGRVPVTASFRWERRRETFPPGSVRVPTDQPLGDLAIALLEPASPDSFFRWGFFLETLQQTEYVEEYVMEPMAARMLEADGALRAEFARRLREEPAFAADPAARLRWFYEKTPFFDARHRLYPVAREP